MMSFDLEWRRCQKAANAALERRLPQGSQQPTRLHEAMRYATLNGGKRFRAVLVMMTGQVFGTEPERLMAPAAAVECVHAYSLVHDDLPCMDDDDYRRGMPSCHKKYDEATAVLVGDALQALAFQILSSDESLVNLTDRTGLLVATLAEAVGSMGMVGGQVLDIQYENGTTGDVEPITINQLKTAKLIQACVRLGARVSETVTDDEYRALSDYGECVGLAFQFRDDQLDDDALDENPVDKANKMRDRAIERIQPLDRDTENLERLAEFVVSRKM